MSAPRSKRLAIVGAGPAGLAAAWKLRHDKHIDITLFEKSRGVSGRAATRSRHGVRLDLGANYFRTDLPEVADLVKCQLPSSELVRIKGDVAVFDRNGVVSPGEQAMNGESKWTYRHGISTLGKLLARSSGCRIHYGVRIVSMRRQRASRAWQLTDEHGVACGEFDAVLLAVPAPQAAALLVPEQDALRAALLEASYQSQWSFSFGFDAATFNWPSPDYALINQDRQHRIAWLSHENAKPGRVPAGTLVLMAQMQPAWSVKHFEQLPAQLALEVCAGIADLLGWAKAVPNWFECQRWKFALPIAKANTTTLRAAETDGVFVAGDAVIGKGRVGQALQTGLDIAERIR